MIRESGIALAELDRTKTTYIVCEPSHVGVHGNEVADELAKMGSDIDFMGPVPALVKPFSIFKQN